LTSDYGKIIWSLWNERYTISVCMKDTQF